MKKEIKINMNIPNDALKRFLRKVYSIFWRH